MVMIRGFKGPAYGLVDTNRLTAATRRQFLKAGGMLVAFAMGGKAFAGTIAGSAGPAGWDPNTEFDGFQPGGFIRIGRDNAITLIMPNTEMGQGVYTGQATLIAEELEVGLDQVAVVPAPPNAELYAQPILKQQATGNSTSIRAFWDPLRQAGAAARMMLVGAAAARWGVPAAELVAERGVVSHKGSGQSATYGELVDDAMKQDLPQDVPLKARQDFKLIGQPLKRLDTPDKVNGKTQYGIDVKVDGMRVATVMACPVAGGRLAGVDDAKARAIPGVIDVLKLDNAVAVVASHYFAARKGIDALEIDWDFGERANNSSAQMTADLEKAFGVVAPVPAASAGDVEEAFKAAAKTVEATYRLPFLAHATLEPMNTTVHVREGGCEIWVGTQVPVLVQTVAAGVLGVEPSKVVVNNFQMGGGYGRRLTVESVVQALLLAKQVSYPLKVIWSREEDIRQGVYRPMYLDRVSGAIDADGRLTALVDHVSGGSVLNSYIPTGWPEGQLDPDAVSGVAETVYAIDNKLVDWTRVDPPVTVSWWRGVGETHNTFVVESFMDEAAHAAGVDPVAFRLKLLEHHPRAAAVLKKAAELAHWDEPLPARTGRGVSLHEAFGSPLALVVQVHVTEAGDIELQNICAALDCGIAVNPDTLKAQVEGGTLFGISAALYNAITFEEGRVQQGNFDDYPQLRIDEAPPFEVAIVEGGEAPGGVGESGTVSAAPALANAIFAATGVRVRDLPFANAELKAGS